MSDDTTTPEELRHRIEAFRRLHEARTKQPLDEAGAVRLLVLRGLAAMVGERTCPRCGQPFPPGKRADAVWCSKACATAESAVRCHGRAKVLRAPVPPCP